MRVPLALLLVLAALALAGCGGGEEVAPLPEGADTSGVTVTPDETEDMQTEPEETTAGGETETGGGGGGGGVPGDPSAGEQVFASAGCGGCHTLEAAGSTGTVGPNLDEAAPEYETIVQTVANGSGAMPAFEGQLSEQEIQNVAAFVFQATHG